MGNLPRDRVIVAHPFNKVGVDSANPLLMKSSKIREAAYGECYISLFLSNESCAYRVGHRTFNCSVSSNAKKNCLKKRLANATN